MKLAHHRWFTGTAEPAHVEVVAEEEWAPGVFWRVVEADGERYQLVADADGNDRLGELPVARVLLERTTGSAEADTVRLMGVEQSNTSVVFDERVVVKLFRRLADGPNLDVEVTTALAGVGFDRIAAPRGSWRREGEDLAFAQDFLRGAIDGWSRATGTESSFAAAESSALGRLTAEMHLALARAYGTVTVDGRAAVRIHGDYHLGQVLFSEGRWYVTDFEGEPLRPAAERTRFRSPLVDVAGMLRSFDYAANVGARGGDWEQACRTAFVTGYLATAGIEALLPADDHVVDGQLREFEIEKARYELAYEQAHRPDWVRIPSAALARLGAG